MSEEKTQSEEQATEHDEETQKLINIVATDIIKTTNLFQAFEIIKERAFIYAENHVLNEMSDEEKSDVLAKVADLEAQQANENSPEASQVQDNEQILAK